MKPPSSTGHPKYKDFPKHDLRRYFALLFAIERLKQQATMHYLALELDCTRAEVQRAVEAAQKFFFMEIEKTEAVYKIKSWGVLNKAAVIRCMAEPFN